MQLKASNQSVDINIRKNIDAQMQFNYNKYLP